MKRILLIEGDALDLDRSITFAKKLQKKLPTDFEIKSIPLQDLSILAEQMHVAMREATTNTNINMKEFLGIDKALRRVQSVIINNATNLSELDKQLDCDQGKLEKIKDDPSYSKELKGRIRERIENTETEREARLKVLLMNTKELRRQVSKIKEFLAEISDSNTSIFEKLRIFLREQWILLTTTITSIIGIIFTIVLALTGGGGGGSRAAPPKNKLVE